MSSPPEHEVLGILGEEVTGVLGPVTLCIAITVALVAALNPEGNSNNAALGIATAFYSESSDDSAWKKMGGSLVNALIFVVFVGCATMLLVCAFRRGHERWIMLYMTVSAFAAFFFLNGLVALQLLQLARVALDWPSLLFVNANAAALGALTLFARPAPLLVKQGYLVAIAVGTAYAFTWIPAWTTWTLLLAMALYDVFAVLSPWGPLKELVELAEERGQAIPALVYSARPTARSFTSVVSARGGGGSRRGSVRQQGNQGALTGLQALRELSMQARAQPGNRTPQHVTPSSPVGRSLRQDGPAIPDGAAGGPPPGVRPTSSPSLQWADLADSPLQPPPHPPGGPAAGGREEVEEEEAAPLVSAGDSVSLGVSGSGDDWGPMPPAPLSEAGESVWLPEAVRLGLGDFIFYSILVGRASMHSTVTALACYVAVITGLIGTLAWLSVSHNALPALPISIALGTATYFATRYLLEPTVLPLAVHGLYF